MIQVEIEGYDQPVEFEDGTDPEVIQRKVKELVTGVDPRTGQKIGTITEETFTRSLIGAVKEEGPAVAGGIATGVAAAMAGPVTLPVLAGAVALGAAGGESMRQIGQHLSGSLGAPKTSIEAAKRITAKGVEEGAWEVFGGFAMKGARKVLAPFSKSATKEAKEVTDVFKDKLRPIVLLPAEATESRTLDLLQNVAEASLIGGNRIADFKTNRTRFYNDLADSVIDQFGERTDPSDLGNLFVSAVEAKRATHAKVAGILYNNVQNAIDIGGGKSLAGKGIRIYHGRVGRLSESSRMGDIGVHFTEDLETAKELGTGEHLVHDFGVKKTGPPPKGVVHSTDINPDEFIELPDMVDWDMQEVASELSKRGIDIGGIDTSGKKVLFGKWEKIPESELADEDIFDDAIWIKKSSGKESDYGHSAYDERTNQILDHEGDAIIPVRETTSSGKVNIDSLWGVLDKAGYKGIKYINEFEGEGVMSYILNPKEAMKSAPRKAAGLTPESFGGVTAGMDKQSFDAVQSAMDKFSDVGQFSGKLYRSGRVKPSGAIFFSPTEEGAQLYADIRPGGVVDTYIPKSLGRIKHLNLEDPKEAADIAKSIKGGSGINFADPDDIEDVISAVEKMMPVYKKRGYDSVIMSGEGIYGDIPIEIAILNKKLIPKKAVDAGAPGGVQVSTASLKSFIAPMRRIAADLGSIEAKNAGDDLISAIEDLPDTLTFDSARELRSRLISRVDEFSVLNKKAPAIGKAKKMIGLIDGAIEDSLKTFDKAAGRAPTVESKLTPSFGNKVVTMLEDTMQQQPAVRYKGKLYKGEVGMPHFDVARQLPEGTDFSKLGIEDKGWIINGQYVGRIHKSEKWVGPDGTKYFDLEVSRGSKLSSQLVGETGAYDAWRIANRFYKEGQKKFNNTMIRRLIKMAEDTGTGAEMIAPAIFRPGQISKVRKTKMAMDPPTWRKMKGFFVQHLMQKATDVDGVIKGKRLTNLISGKPNSFGLPMMKEVLSDAQVKGLQDMAKALELSQARQAEGAGKVLIQLSQAGAVGVMASGTLELPAATIIFGPALLSRMMLSPPVAKWLTKGITMPANSEVAAGILTRLMASANRIRNNMENEREAENEK